MRVTAEALGRRSEAGVVIMNTAVLDVERGTTRSGMTVFIKDSTIHAIEPGGACVAPPGVLTIDGRGFVLLPGLWDLDDRAPDPEFDASGRRRLAAGVTRVQHVAAGTLFTPLTSRRIAGDGQVGPRLFMACTLDGWYPDNVNGAVPDRRTARGQVRDTSAVRPTLQACARHGMRWAMRNDNLPAALVRVAIEEARRLGMRVTGNRLRGWTSEELIAAGLDHFEHSLQVGASFVEHDSSANAWWRHQRGGINPFWTGGAALSQLDLSAPAVTDLVRAMAERRIGTRSTLCVYPPVNRVAPHDTTHDRVSFTKLQELMKVLHHAGAPIYAATDGACDAAAELALLHAGGIGAADLIRIATIEAAAAVGVEHQPGSVAVGKLADVILVEGDPVADLSALRRIVAVMKHGVLYSDMPAL